MTPSFEVRDPEIDTASLLRRVRDRLEERRLSGLLPPAPPEFGLPNLPEVSDATLRYHLEQANATYDDIWPELTLAPSPVAHVPILGRFWQLVRGHLHRLILFYLDILASKQMRYNEHVAGALNRLAYLEQERVGLCQEMEELRQRITELSESAHEKGRQSG